MWLPPLIPFPLRLWGKSTPVTSVPAKVGKARAARAATGIAALPPWNPHSTAVLASAQESAGMRAARSRISASWRCRVGSLSA